MTPDSGQRLGCAVTKIVSLRDQRPAPSPTTFSTDVIDYILVLWNLNLCVIDAIDSFHDSASRFDALRSASICETLPPVRFGVRHITVLLLCRPRIFFPDAIIWV
jgi:hypothetical protein